MFDLSLEYDYAISTINTTKQLHSSTSKENIIEFMFVLMLYVVKLCERYGYLKKTKQKPYIEYPALYSNANATQNKRRFPC